MAALAPLLLLLISTMISHSSATWCVCKKGGNDKVLQMALDWACGNGADCTQTHQGGKCFNPNTVIDHCSYAVNSYFQAKGQTATACDFNGVAMVTTTDPSANGCSYPSSASGGGGTSSVTNSPASTSTSTGTGTRTPPSPGSTTVTAGGSTTSPYGGNNPTNTGVLGGGVGTGMGSGSTGMNTDTDVSDGFTPKDTTNSFRLLAITILVILCH